MKTFLMLMHCAYIVNVKVSQHIEPINEMRYNIKIMKTDSVYVDYSNYDTCLWTIFQL